jgi:hypothetical protein
MALPKWTDERTSALTDFIGDETPVSQATVQEAATTLETSNKSVAAKLRKMGYEVESSSSVVSRKFSEKQESTLATFVTTNSGNYTYSQIADAFENGEFSSKQIQGKLLSMQLTEHVKPTPKQESVRTFSEKEEATFVSMANEGAYLEDIAEALGRSVNQVRGKALSLLRSESISAIPQQKESKGTTRVDPLEGVDVASMTVEQIADEIGKTARGVKTMLTRRGLTASNYDGAAKAAKANG